MNAHGCPTRAELDSFQAGNLDEVALASVATHVEACTRCQRSLETIIGESGDTVLAALLEEPAPSPFAEEYACRVAVDRVAAFAGTTTSSGEVAPTISHIAASSPGQDESLPLQSIREYKLLAKLGEGGMGAVYKALHTRLDKVVALKVLPQGRMRDGGSVARFQREMKAVGRLDHPNIVRAMDAGEQDGTHFLVMEYVEGIDLSELAKNVGPLPVADACELIRQAAIGLQEAHEHGMVHRDIKPSNLILAKPTRKKSPPTLKILDLGLALLAEALSPDQGLTSTGQMMGTIDYMAPEQGSDTHNVDIRADIYSLGATLYRLLTGSAPFTGEKFDTPVKKILALATQDPAPVQTRRADVPPPLAAIIHKMLAKVPAERFATPDELAEALAPFCQGANLAALLERGAELRSGSKTGEAPTHPHLTSGSVETAPTSLPLPLGEGRGEGVKIKAPVHSNRQPISFFGRKYPRSLAIATACGGAALIVLLGVVFYLETLKGAIRIEIRDPAIKVALDEHGATFQGVDKKHSIKVWAGPHGLTITRGDLKFNTDKFELRKGQILRLRVEFLKGKVEVVDVANNKPLAMLAEKTLAENMTENRRWALRFDGDDRVEVSNLGWGPMEKYTLEAFVTPERRTETVTTVVRLDEVCMLGLDPTKSHEDWFVVPLHQGVYVTAPVAMKKRVHLAGVVSGRQFRLYADGQLVGAHTATANVEPRPGPSLRIGNQFVGTIDGIRVSKSARFDAPFTPPTRFDKDDDTLAVYQFGEGKGDYLIDSSGNGHHGKIVDAKWVRTDETAIKPEAGWHGWPKDAPAPAIAPFDAKQARKHQEEWATYLGVPVEYENSLRMKFVLIPPGEFMIGSTPAEIEATLKLVKDKQWQDCIKSEGPQHRVILTQPIYLGVNEVTQAEYAKVMGKNPSFFAKTGRLKSWVDKVAGLDTAGHPVEGVSWNDAAEFCTKLSEREKLTPCYSRSGETVTMLSGTGYRLPTEAQWEFGCRAGTTTKYWPGEKDTDLAQAGWFGKNSGARTHQAGDLKANPFGLYDVHGNAWEWVQDWWSRTTYGQFQEKPALDPSGPSGGSLRVIRGGDCSTDAYPCRSADHFAMDPLNQSNFIGFRAVLPVQAVKKAIAERPTASTGWHGWPTDAPAPAIAPFDAKQARRHQKEWADYLGLPVEIENSIRMKFILIPPGEFIMGSTTEEIEEALKAPGDQHWLDCHKSEAPKHKVVLTQPIYLGIHEVTQGEYERVMGTNPSHFAAKGTGRDSVVHLDPATHPVEMVRWSDAAEFCIKLSEREKFEPFYFRNGEAVRVLEGTGYRLPSEATWEFACRAGTTTKYWIGDEDVDLPGAAWFEKNSDKRTHSVCELRANAFGLFDIHGNVWEWVQDWWEPTYYAQFVKSPAIDPNGPTTGSQRVLRGGAWDYLANGCRSSHRLDAYPADPHNYRGAFLGFRVALTVDAVRIAVANSSIKPSPKTTNHWQGWPNDAPRPAIAPFDAAQAKKHQEEWAEYLGVPVEYENSIRMKFVIIPPGEFTMGSTPEQIEEGLKITGDNPQWQKCIKSEGPQHKVILTQPMYLGVHEVTQGDYEKVMGSNPSYFAKTGHDRDYAAKVSGLDTTGFPVEGVNWDQAVEFCAMLSEQEKLKPFQQSSGEPATAPEANGYRLPTEALWEFACRAGTTTRFWSGAKDADLAGAAWYRDKSDWRTHKVGELKANPLGLHDMHGNVWEWVGDGWEPAYYAQFQEKPAQNPSGPAAGVTERVLRGGGCTIVETLCLSSRRFALDPTIPLYADNGFRVSLSVDAVKASLAERKINPPAAANTGWQGWPKESPQPAIAPFDAEQAKRHREAWANYLKVPEEHENSLGMKFILIPPGEFLMGSTPEEIEAALKIPEEMERKSRQIQSEGPRHKVILTQPYYLGVHEVTQSAYEQVMGTNPSQFSAGGVKKNVMKGIDSSKHPVEDVSWNDAVEFCAKLSQRDRLQPWYERKGETVTFLEGTGYRLPTEAQWEFACRAGTTTKCWTGDDDEAVAGVGWLGSSGGRTQPVGELQANPFGLHDIHGNVWEWVQDRWSADYYALWTERPAIDPAGPGSANPTTTGSMRPVRGGSWGGPPSHARSSSRETPFQYTRVGSVGFRVALPMEAVKQTIKE